MKKDPLEKCLALWRHESQSSPNFAESVLSRAKKTERDRFARTQFHGFGWRKLAGAPLATGLAAALLVAITLILGNRGSELEADQGMQQQLLAWINPTQSLRTQFADVHDWTDVKRPDLLSRKSFSETIKWLEEKVAISPDQALQFETIHEGYYQELASMVDQLITLENEYRSHERTRVNGGNVDLVSVYENVKKQNAIYQSALQIQQQFLNQVFQILNQEQENVFGGLLLAPPKPLRPSADQTTPSEWQI